MTAPELYLPDLRTREAKAAQTYMCHKGYPDIRPTSVIRIEDDDCWYFYYLLPEGILELEVCSVDRQWTCKVTAFQMNVRPKGELTAA